MAVVRAVKQDLGSDGDPGNISEIYLHLVHADAADDGSAAPFHQNFSHAGEPPGEPIVVAERDNSNSGFPLRGEGAVITQRLARRELLDRGNAAGDADCE